MELALILLYLLTMENTYLKHVLLVDDEERYLYAMVDHLMFSGRNVCILTAENGEKGLSVLGATQVDLVVTDLHMPVMDGFRFISEVRKRYPDMPIIVMSTELIPATEKRLAEMGVSDCIDKFNVRTLTDKILHAVKANFQEATR